MEVTFEKRTYQIKDGDDIYEVFEIIKHSIEEYNYRHISRVCNYTECDDYPECSGFKYYEPSEELLKKINNLINQTNNEGND
jgi:hypothetical protein